MSMALIPNWDDSEGNKTDIYTGVGAAGNLRFPGKGFKPPADPGPRVDRANFAVKPEGKKAEGVSFDERQKRANFEDVRCFTSPVLPTDPRGRRC